MTQMDPGAPDPIGTKAEVKKLRLPLVKYATCSLPGKANRGCRHFDDPALGACPIRALLARRGRPGPENVAVVTIKSPTQKKQDAMPCFVYMGYLAKVSPMQAVSDVIGLGGDKTIRRRTTTPVEPNNPRSRTKLTFEPELVPRFPRPAESMADRVEAITMAEDIRAARANRHTDAMDAGYDSQEEDEQGTELTEDDFVEAGEDTEDAGGPKGQTDAADTDDEELDLDDDDADPDEAP
jgi:hypothetical protein